MSCRSVPLLILLGLDEKQSTELVKEIVSWKLIDILEISGGNYSSPGTVFPRPFLVFVD